MSSNETDTPRNPALERAEAARDAVAQAIEDHLDRLAAVNGTSRADLDADLRAAGRLMARNTHRQLAANLTLVRRMMEARSLSAMLQVQQDFLHRQAEWAMRDWERMSTQVRALLEEGRRGAGPEPAEPEVPPSEEPEVGPPVSGTDRPDSS